MWVCGYSGDIMEPIWCNCSTLAQNAIDVGSIPTLATLFPIFITPTSLLLPSIINLVTDFTIILKYICRILHHFLVFVTECRQSQKCS